jgi:hypothetical protein
MPMSKVIPETPPEYDRTRIVERPDGFYWQDKDGGREYGPFATLLEAVQDMELGGDRNLEPGESLEEAENEIGMSDYIDPDTGVPAEDGVPRLEDH